MTGPRAVERVLDRLNKNRLMRAFLKRSIGDALSVYETDAASGEANYLAAYESYFPRLLTLPQYRWFNDVLEFHVALRGGIRTAADDGVSWTGPVHDHNHNNRYAEDDVPCSDSPIVQRAVDQVVKHPNHLTSTIPDRIWNRYTLSNRRMEAEMLPSIIEQCIYVGNLIGPVPIDRNLDQEAIEVCLTQTRDGVRETVAELGGSVDRVDEKVAPILSGVSVKEILSESSS